MGSRRFGGVRFVVYSNDHVPRHVHAFCDGGEVIVDLLAEEKLALANRTQSVRNAKASAVRKVLEAAAAHYQELCELWNSIHQGAKEEDSNGQDGHDYEGDSGSDQTL